MAAKHIPTSGESMDIINHYVDGFRAAMLMTTACELGILDKVEKVPGGISGADLAQSEGWNQDATCRFMDAMAALKFLTKSKNTSGKDVFTVTGPGRHLLKDIPGTIESIAPFLVTGLYPTFQSVAKIVKEGAPKPEEFDFKMSVIEHQAIGSCLKPYLKDVIRAFDLSNFKTVVDLGAGCGDFTFALRAAYPPMHITMNDLPTVTEVVEQHIIPKEGQTNISVLPGSFLDVELPQADLFIICKTLHHLDRHKQVALIQKVYNSTNPGGAFLIVEKILYDNRAGPSTGNLWDIFCLTGGEGIMSTETEYTNLLKEAGFGNIELARTNDDCPYDVMIGRKP